MNFYDFDLRGADLMLNHSPRRHWCGSKGQVVLRQQTQLSTKAKENLQRNAELRQRDNKFIKLQSGEKKILFFPEKIEQVEAEFNGRKSMRFRYTVIEEGTEQEKYLDRKENLWRYRLLPYGSKFCTCWKFWLTVRRR